MKLGIVGTGAMGQVLLTCAKSDPDIAGLKFLQNTHSSG